MATREDNLKKINDELEKLSDEELDQVAGGKAWQMADDSRFLNVLLAGKPGQCDRYGSWKMYWSNGCYIGEIENAWSHVGIEAHLNSGFIGNKYKIMGTDQSLTQEQARQYAMNYVGRQLKESDWNW